MSQLCDRARIGIFSIASWKIFFCVKKNHRGSLGVHMHTLLWGGTSPLSKPMVCTSGTIKKLGLTGGKINLSGSDSSILRPGVLLADSNSALLGGCSSDCRVCIRRIIRFRLSAAVSLCILGRLSKSSRKRDKQTGSGETNWNWQKVRNEPRAGGGLDCSRNPRTQKINKSGAVYFGSTNWDAERHLDPRGQLTPWGNKSEIFRCWQVPDVLQASCGHFYS